MALYGAAIPFESGVYIHSRVASILFSAYAGAATIYREILAHFSSEESLSTCLGAATIREPTIQERRLINHIWYPLT